MITYEERSETRQIQKTIKQTVWGKTPDFFSYTKGGPVSALQGDARGMTLAWR